MSRKTTPAPGSTFPPPAGSTSLATLVAGVSIAAGQIIHSDAAFTMTNADGLVGWDIDGAGLNPDVNFKSGLFIGPNAFGVIDPSSKPAGEFAFVGLLTTNYSLNGFIFNLSTTRVISQAMATSVGPLGQFVSGLGFRLSSPTSNPLVFLDEQSGYMGFRFGVDEENLTYGWARLTYNSGASSLTIHEWAYESSGGAIRVGAVPEPAAVATGLGALALGAAGLRRWRLRRPTS